MGANCSAVFFGLTLRVSTPYVTVMLRQPTDLRVPPTLELI